jgi:ABC-type nitrate/sulfonate/bicarbonate transport system substrate-binding protein
MRLRQLFMTTVILFLASDSSTVSAELVKIRYGWVVVPASLVPVMKEKQGLLRNHGKTYELELTRFQGTSTQITALASGDLDIAALAFSAFGLAIENAKLSDLRVIADEGIDGYQDYYSDEYMVLKNGPVKSVGNLKGRVLATSAIGSAVDIAMRAMLRRHQLEDKKDYSVIEVPFPTMKSILIEGKADLIPSVPPFSYDKGLLDAAHTLFTMKDAMQGPAQISAWAARTAFIEKHRAALLDFIEDYLRGVRWFHEPANRAEAIELIARFTKIPASVFEGWVLTKKDEYRDPTGRPNVEIMQKNLDQTKAAGFLNTRIDAKAYTDASVVEEAWQRLK